MAQDVPFANKASYQTTHYNAGIPGAPSVFAALATPPASGVAAETAANNSAKAKGVLRPNTQALALRTANRDFLRDFYDSASIL